MHVLAKLDPIVIDMVYKRNILLSVEYKLVTIQSKEQWKEKNESKDLG